MKFLVRISTCHNFTVVRSQLNQTLSCQKPQNEFKKTRSTIDTIGFRISIILYWKSIRDDVNSSKKRIKYNHDRVLGRHFCWGSGAPTIWISKGPRQNLKGTSIEIHYQFSNFGGSIGPSGKISQGPHWIFRGPWPLPPGPREPCMTIKRHHSVPMTLILIAIFKKLVSYLSEIHCV